MPRVNKIYGPTTTIKIVLDNHSTQIVEKYDPEVAMNGLTNFLDEIGISYVLIDQETISIPQAYDRIVYIDSRFNNYLEKHPELSHIGIRFI